MLALPHGFALLDMPPERKALFICSAGGIDPGMAHL